MIQRYVTRHRILISRLFVVSLGLLILFGKPLLVEDAVARLTMLLLASALVIIAVLGRLWCSLYLCGYKNLKVVDVGPFSIVRNPLYVFSLLGAMGIALATTSIVIVLMLLLFFSLLYSQVIGQEEQELEKSLGQEYLDYRNRTPKWIPNFSLYTGVRTYTINLKQVHSAFRDVLWFFVLLVAAAAVAELHRQGVFPGWFLLP